MKRYNAENASYYYDTTTQYHFVFTNHIINADHADGFYVNWPKDSDNWDPANRVLLMSSDTNTCTWSTGAIGMPSVVKVDDSKLAVIYDAVQDIGTGHLHRKIGLAYLNLTLVPLNDLTRTDWTSDINSPFCTERVDCYSPVLQCQQELFLKTFEIGTYTVKIVNYETKNEHSSGTYIDLNEFRNADIATDCRIKL